MTAAGAVYTHGKRRPSTQNLSVFRWKKRKTERFVFSKDSHMEEEAAGRAARESAPPEAGFAKSKRKY